MSVAGDATPFELSIPSVRNDFQVLAFEGTEAVSSLYAIRIEVVSDNPDFDLDSLLRKPAFLRFGPAGEGIHGYIEDVLAGRAGKRLTHYHLSLVPALHYLQLSFNQRIFQNLTVPQIVGQVLKSHGILADVVEFRTGECHVREYCTQHDENDFEFIQRLCSEDGISWHYEHGPRQHRMVFVDNHHLFPKTTATPYHDGPDPQARVPVISRFAMRCNSRTERTVRRGDSFKSPGYIPEADCVVEPAGGSAGAVYPPPEKYTRRWLEDYRYSPVIADEKQIKRLARHALERHRADHRIIEGGSDQSVLRSGRFLPLREHPRQHYNDFWLLLSVTHLGEQPQVLEELQDHGATNEPYRAYRNTFSAIHWHVSYRPPLVRRKSALVSQTARVTGPEGQDIFCDEYGRVKVRFHWDRSAVENDTNSCWLRVSTSWAGASFGAVVIPRVGMEVVVTFLDGDPDKPLITGCVPNEHGYVPYPLPANNTRTVLRSRSTSYQQGQTGGYNELSIEDRGGRELIYLRAQRDMQQMICNDSLLEVGNQRHELIKGNSVTVLEAEEQRSVGADRKVSLKANDFLQVAGRSHTMVKETLVVEAGQNIHIKAGAHLTLEAGAKVTLKSGGHHIVLGQDGIFSSLLILPGGDPHAGQGALVLPPGMPDGSPAAAALPLPDLRSYQQHSAAGSLLPGACCQPGAKGHCPVHQEAGRT